MKPALIVSLLALAGTAALAFHLHGAQAALEARLAALEEDAAAGADMPAPAPGEPGLAGAGLPRDVAELRGTTDALMDRMESLERRAALGAGPSAAPPAVDAAGLAEAPGFHDAVRAVVLEMAKGDVDFRARLGSGERTKVPKNAPFRKVAELLQLDASQAAAMGKDLQSIQTELFTLLSEERADGVAPLEIIAKAEALGPGDPRRGEMFVKLFTLEIPGGGGETYMQRAVKLQQGFRAKTDAYLRAQQKELLDAIEVDWFSIKFD